MRFSKKHLTFDLIAETSLGRISLGRISYLACNSRTLDIQLMQPKSAASHREHKDLQASLCGSETFSNCSLAKNFNMQTCLFH